MLTDLIKGSIDAGASDIHLTENGPYRHRIDGVLQPLPNTHVSAREIQDAVFSVANVAPGDGADFAVTLLGVRMRGTKFRSVRGLEVVLRILNQTIPEIDNLHLPECVKNIIKLKKGLVLFSGTTGSGKTTTIASIIQEINRVRAENIITIEQPIEYLFEDNMCKISQREVPTHVDSFITATVEAMRQDPDILFLGEIRDLTTTQNALTLAETGHLVFATIHTRNPVESVDRIVDQFPAEQQTQIRNQLANVLEVVTHQTLLPTSEGRRYCMMEVMFVTDTIRKSLKDAKPTAVVRDQMISEHKGYSLMDAAVDGIANHGVSYEDTMPYLSGISIPTLNAQLEQRGVQVPII